MGGDDLCRTLVQQAGGHLNEGGYAQFLANWQHVEGEEWQDRLRSWVPYGCDAWIVQREVQDVTQYAELWLRDSGDHRSDPADYDERYEAWLDEFEDGEAAPDLMGVNHYVTGERFLDHRVGLYPAHMHGGNGRHAYVDTEAARVDLVHGALGWAARLREVWERYRRPIAVTEAHLGDRPEEQVRWLLEAWDAAQALRTEGADLRAVTVWALFGAVDWDSLLRCRNGRYEAGAFDARHDPPRPTLLAKAVAALAATGRFDHPALDTPGWWRRDDRLHVRRSA